VSTQQFDCRRRGIAAFFRERFGAIMPAIAGLLVLLAPTAQAGSISFVNIFGNISYEQIGDGNTLTLNGTFFSADLNSSVANAYTSASVIYPGPGSPQTLTQGSPTDYHFQTALLPDLATMEAAYPMGTYTFQGVNGPNTDTATLDYSTDDYPQSNAYLTGTDYSSLQGMDATQDFTFHFNPDITGSNATASFIFFTIYDETAGTVAFSDAFLPASTTSVVLPANTLTSGHLYDYELDYSNRDILSNPGDADSGPQLGFDTRTDGLFATAAPEPASAAMLVIAGFAGLLLLKRRAKITA
jgi:hypothetical protein